MKDWLKAEVLRLGNTMRWSWQGWCAAWSAEKSLRQWTGAQAVSIALLLVLDVPLALAALIVALGFLVLASELFNTALEAVVNDIGTDIRPAAKLAKDCASAGVALTALAAGSAWVFALAGIVAPG